jgi:deazaflavin-dependent oxidoreductase (nitroreductase family)
MTTVHDWNKGIIEEFRANQGKVGGRFAGAPVILLTHTGARTGKVRTNPLVCLPDGDRYYVFASKGGAPTHPDWYYNLVANPKASVEFGTEKFDVEAEVITGDERDRIFQKQSARIPAFADYQRGNKRTIPVIALKRKG